MPSTVTTTTKEAGLLDQLLMEQIDTKYPQHAKREVNPGCDLAHDPGVSRSGLVRCLRLTPTATLGFVADVLPSSAAGAATLNFSIAARGFINVHAFYHFSVTLLDKVLLAALNSGHRGPLTTKSIRSALPNVTEKSGGRTESIETVEPANGKLAP